MQINDRIMIAHTLLLNRISRYLIVLITSRKVPNITDHGWLSEYEGNPKVGYGKSTVKKKRLAKNRSKFITSLINYVMSYKFFVTILLNNGKTM